MRADEKVRGEPEESNKTAAVTTQKLWFEQ